MASKKKAEPEIIEEQTTEMEITVPTAEEPKEEPTLSEEEIVERFIDQQLMVINRMKNKAKARRLAKRILENRKRF